MRPVVGAGGGDWGACAVELSRAQLLGKVSAAKEQNKFGAGANAVQTVLKKESVRSENVPNKDVFPAKCFVVSQNDLVESGDVSLCTAPLMSRGCLWQNAALCRLRDPDLLFNKFRYFCESQPCDVLIFHYV